jgi:hypothetical protein
LRITSGSTGVPKNRALLAVTDLDEVIPCILESEEGTKKFSKNWARLIQKIYEMDALTCPKCQGRMKIIAFIEDEEVIEKILKHLGSWDLEDRPPSKVKALSVTISDR